MKKIRFSILLILCFVLGISTLASADTKNKTKESKEVSLSKTTVELATKVNYKLKIAGDYEKVSWKSSKKSVATVSKKGIVETHKKGTAYIYATVDNIKLKCKVKVVNPKLTTTKIFDEVGYSEDLIVLGTYSDVKWSSTDESVAYVDKEGKVLFVGSGKAKITAKVVGTKLTCNVEVTVSDDGY